MIKKFPPDVIYEALQTLEQIDAPDLGWEPFRHHFTDEAIEAFEEAARWDVPLQSLVEGANDIAHLVAPPAGEVRRALEGAPLNKWRTPAVIAAVIAIGIGIYAAYRYFKRKRKKGPGSITT